MVENPRPTRAEVTDVANAILDGTDAIMLSEETAAGAYPVQAVKVMAKVAADVEPLFDHAGWNTRLKASTTLSFEAAVAHTAVEMADDIGAAAILTCTTSGSTSRQVARYRPRQPLLAMTPEPRTAVRLALTFGAVPVLMGPTDNAEALERGAIAAALQNGYVTPGQAVVITAGLPFHRAGTTNIIKVATAEWD
jgi:pyruvate kinase